MEAAHLHNTASSGKGEKRFHSFSGLHLEELALQSFPIMDSSNGLKPWFERVEITQSRPKHKNVSLVQCLNQRKKCFWLNLLNIIKGL